MRGHLRGQRRQVSQRPSLGGPPDSRPDHARVDVVLVAPAARPGREEGTVGRWGVARRAPRQQLVAQHRAEVDLAHAGLGLSVRDIDVPVCEVDVSDVDPAELVGRRDALPRAGATDPGFRDRLRALSQAAATMRDAHAQALEAGLAWRPGRQLPASAPTLRTAARHRPPRPPRALDPLRRRSSTAQRRRRRRQPALRGRRLRLTSPGRLGAGRRAAGRRRVAGNASSRDSLGCPSSSWSASTAQFTFTTTRSKPPLRAAEPWTLNDLPAPISPRRLPGIRDSLARG
jgi:hypothetical protein